MIILSHFYTHSLFTSLFLLNNMFQPSMAIMRFECKFEVIAQKLYYLFIFPIFVWSNNNIKYKICGLECC
jgi:hypothetical protein